MTKIDEIAKMIDHSILHPTFTDEDLLKNCEIAWKYNVATVCVKPYHVKMASGFLKGSDVGICAVIGFPHGNSTTEIKKMEAMQVIQDGAVEVDMVVNIGKVLQKDWDYINKELIEINSVCTANKAGLKVIFETDFVTKDDDKIKLCQLCNANNVAFVKTSTGYGFVKGEEGQYNYVGATLKDVVLMRKYCNSNIQVKAAGGIRNLEQVLKMKESGATRIGATATEMIMEEAKIRFK